MNSSGRGEDKENTDLLPLESPTNVSEDSFKRQLNDTLPPSPPPTKKQYSDWVSSLLVPPWISAAINLVPGAVLIRYFCNPATFRRRYTLLVLHSTFVWWNQHRANSIAPFAQAYEDLEDMQDPSVSLKGLEKDPQMFEKVALYFPTMVYGLRPEIRAKDHAIVAARVTDSMIANYIEEESIRDRQLGFMDFLRFKYRNSWSSVGTRASVADILHTKISQWGLDKSIGDQDIRRCTSHIADVLENGLPKEPASMLLYWPGFLTMMFFSRPVIFLAGAGYSAYGVVERMRTLERYNQAVSEMRKYRDPVDGIFLHAAWIQARRSL